MNKFKIFSKSKIDGPVFLKEFDRDNNTHLNQLTDLLLRVGDDQKALIEEQIKLINIGLVGEQNTYFEITHSYIPLLCLHDIRLEYKGLAAQFDFIIICHSFIMVLETKSLYGDISIDSEGNFTRYFKDYRGAVYKKEGMYSPISQNQKHVDLLQRFLMENKMDYKLPIYSLVVVANPKTLINKRYATKEVQNSIIKYDQIKNELIKRQNQNNNVSDKVIITIGNFILENDKPIEFDFIKRFNLKVKAEETPKVLEDKEEIITTDEEVDITVSDELYEKLRQYRNQKAKEKEYEKTYFVFNNQVISDLVLNLPSSKEELLKIPGFGPKRVDEYGDDIISIIKDYLDEENTEDITSEKENDHSTLYKELRQYRFNKATKENIKPYMVFNNNTLDSLCELKPQSMEELLNIPGFGEVKLAKYGQDIIDIIKKN